MSTTTRMTFGSVLSTIQTTANTVTATLDAANTGIGMLTAFVEEAAANQKSRQIANRESFLANLINEKAIEDSNAALQVDKFLATSARHKELFAQKFETYTNLLRPTQQ